MGAETPNPNPSEGEKVVERLSEFADMVALQPPILLLSGGVAHAQSVMVNGRTISAHDIRHALALLSAKDARIMELTAALEPFARAATRQPIMAGRGSNTNYRTPADTDPFVRLMSWGDFRRASRALAASKGVE